jgi:hypothetical protein
MYKVVLLNDDFTPMDFVIHVLQKFFSKEIHEATRIMMQVHQSGAGIAGVPHDIGHRVMAQSRAPDTEHDGLDDPGPEQEGTSDKRDRSEPDCNATGDKQDTGDHEGCRDDPEEPRVFDRTSLSSPPRVMSRS